MIKWNDAEKWKKNPLICCRVLKPLFEEILIYKIFVDCLNYDQPVQKYKCTSNNFQQNNCC